MRRMICLVLMMMMLMPAGCALRRVGIEGRERATVVLRGRALASGAWAVRLDKIFYETEKGRVNLPEMRNAESGMRNGEFCARVKMADGRTVTVGVREEEDDYCVKLAAEPAAGIKKWGLAIPAEADEAFTGALERVVDGPQSASWKEGRKEALDLRGQKIEMLVKPTLALYAPFYLSSRGYGLFVRGTWPGMLDFCSGGAGEVKVEFEGPVLELKVYLGKTPLEIVAAHALDAGPPLLPPKWAFTPWRWLNEHKNRSEYYDGTPVIGPYNSQLMEDVLLMKHYGIPCGVYWIDRPWGPGRMGYDDFEIDRKRLPEFASMVRWLAGSDIRLVMWIAPFAQGLMAKEALEKHYNYPAQDPKAANYPLIDFSNPRARAFWQAGVAKLLKQGIAGFKLDRSEEDIADRGEEKVADGRTLTENRNDYPVQYVRATYEVARQYRGEDFILLPRAAYTGSAGYGAFWGGDIGTSAWGLRASIVGLQRAAVMGYPFWGSDTGGYSGKIDREVTARWLALSCFSPIMEVGPTANRGFWDMAGEPKYDLELIAIWRFYARLHVKLLDYTYRQAKEAHEAGTPIARPLGLAYPRQKAARAAWDEYLYGPDILVAPVWEKGVKEREVYLPAGEKWVDAWTPGKVYRGGRTVRAATPLFAAPIFVRQGSGVELGDLNREYAEALAAAAKQPAMRRLDEGLRAHFDAEAAETEK